MNHMKHLIVMTFAAALFGAGCSPAVPAAESPQIPSPAAPEAAAPAATTSGEVAAPAAKPAAKKPAPAPKPVTGYVTIKDLKFSPTGMTVKVGTTVVWTNNDTHNHTVQSEHNIFSSANLAPGKSFSYTFNSVGTYNYYCAIHPDMKGMIIVK
jgi:plastocyanin